MLGLQRALTHLSCAPHFWTLALLSELSMDLTFKIWRHTSTNCATILPNQQTLINLRFPRQFFLARSILHAHPLCLPLNIPGTQTVHCVWRNFMGGVYLGQTLVRHRSLPSDHYLPQGYQHDTDVPSSRIMYDVAICAPQIDGTLPPRNAVPFHRLRTPSRNRTPSEIEPPLCSDK
jgi:hypothetical protein